MRYKIYFKLEEECLSMDYRRNILSFIKHSLMKYDENYFKRLYNEKDNIIKPYTYSVYFRNAQFKGENIFIKDKEFELNISVEDYNIGIILYNALNNQKTKKFSLNKNSMKIEKIVLLREKEINEENINIKFLSPLVVRNRNRETKKDYYYSFNNEKFIETLKINIREQLKNSRIQEGKLDTFKIIPIQAKKTVVKFYEKQIECSIGTFQISGDKDLLNYLYKAGIGSKRSSGFGMFDII